jgi:hypothetical protein
MNNEQKTKALARVTYILPELNDGGLASLVWCAEQHLQAHRRDISAGTLADEQRQREAGHPLALDPEDGTVCGGCHAPRNAIHSALCPVRAGHAVRRRPARPVEPLGPFRYTPEGWEPVAAPAVEAHGQPLAVSRACGAPCPGVLVVEVDPNGGGSRDRCTVCRKSWMREDERGAPIDDLPAALVGFDPPYGAPRPAGVSRAMANAATNGGTLAERHACVLKIVQRYTISPLRDDVDAAAERLGFVYLDPAGEAFKARAALFEAMGKLFGTSERVNEGVDEAAERRLQSVLASGQSRERVSIPTRDVPGEVVDVEHSGERGRKVSAFESGARAMCPACERVVSMPDKREQHVTGCELATEVRS